MSKDEIKTNSRMGKGSNRGEAKRASFDYPDTDPVPRKPRPYVNMETSDVPMRSLSDVWPEDQNVQAVRMLPPIQGSVSKPKMSRRVDRRPIKKVAQVTEEK